jgi:hypothetical protein
MSIHNHKVNTNGVVGPFTNVGKYNINRTQIQSADKDADGDATVGFRFPEDIWRLIKSILLSVEPRQCTGSYNCRHAIYGGPVLRFPVFSSIDGGSASLCLRPNGFYDPTECVVAVDHHIQWCCEDCLDQHLEMHIPYSDSRNTYRMASVNYFRYTCLREEREAWYLATHGADKREDAVREAKEYIEILRDQHNREWSIATNLADLETYWDRYKAYIGVQCNEVREVLTSKCTILNTRINREREEQKNV